MRLIPLVALIAFPLLEIIVLVQVGGQIGFWWTLALILMTAILGMAIIVQNGTNAAIRVQQAMQRGEPPLAPMVDSAMVVVAGVLLVTPGVLADTLGLLMLAPFVRRLLARGLGRTLFGAFGVSASTADGGGPFDDRDPRTGRPSGTRPGPVIDGEFTRVDEPASDPNRKRPDGPSRP